MREKSPLRKSEHCFTVQSRDWCDHAHSGLAMSLVYDGIADRENSRLEPWWKMAVSTVSMEWRLLESGEEKHGVKVNRITKDAVLRTSDVCSMQCNRPKKANAFRHLRGNRTYAIALAYWRSAYMSGDPMSQTLPWYKSRSSSSGVMMSSALRRAAHRFFHRSTGSLVNLSCGNSKWGTAMGSIDDEC